MKIKHTTFSGFRNVPDAEYALDGKNILLVAENGFGKTHFQHAIKIALGKMMAGPGAIKEGAEEANLEVIMANYTQDYVPIEGTEYKFKCRIRTTKGGEQKVELEVICPNGIKEEGKTIIGSLVGEIELKESFVKLSLTPAGKARQLEIIKGYLDDESKVFIRLSQQKIDGWYKDRTEVNRKVAALEGSLKTSTINPLDLQKTWEPVVTSKLIEDRDTIAKANTEHDKVLERSKLRTESIVTKRGEIKDIEDQIAELVKKCEIKQGEIKIMEGLNEQADKWVGENPKASTAALDEQIKGAEAHNQMCKAIAEYRTNETELAKLTEESGSLTVMIDSGRHEIQDMLRNLDTYPIPGVTFDEENVYYHGNLVHPDVMSEAEQTVFEAQLKLLAMDKAKVLFIGNGSLIGYKNLVALQAECDKRGIQMIMEEVERGTEQLEIRMMPDYRSFVTATEDLTNTNPAASDEAKN